MGLTVSVAFHSIVVHFNRDKYYHTEGVVDEWKHFAYATECGITISQKSRTRTASEI
jgi:hypothetical protein